MGLAPGSSFGVLAGLQIQVAGSDVIPPTIRSLDPPDDATVGVPLDTDLVVTFDEPVAFGTGDITLRTSGGGLVEAFDVTNSPNLSLLGARVTIDPTSDFLAGSNYYVEIATTARDALVYYEIVLIGDGAMTATVDDFGVPEPPPAAGLILIVR